MRYCKYRPGDIDVTMLVSLTELRPRVTFSTSGLSYFNITLNTVHNLYNVDELGIQTTAMLHYLHTVQAWFKLN